MTQPFELTEKQVELRRLAASKARHILGVGGSRSGKTFGFCYCVATRALMAPNSRHLICRLHNIDVRQAVMMDTFPAMMRVAYPQVSYTPNKADQFVVLHTAHGESEIWFGGLDDKERVEKILGKEYATIYPNECSQIAFETITTLRTRLAQNVNKINGQPLPLKAYYDLNPVGRSHWTYLEFIKLVRPENRLPLKDPATRGHLFMNPEDNPNLPAEYLDELDELPERQRQRFKEGKYLSEVPGTLWPIDRIDATRVGKSDVPDFKRIVVAVDPSGSDGTGGDVQGIIVAAEGVNGHFYVLEDASCRMSPAGWGARVAQRYDYWNADCVVAEVNYGGAMVESTIRQHDPNINVKVVTASRGKHLRAEPIAALYEATTKTEVVDGIKDTVEVKPAKAHHVGTFAELEEQMAMFTTEGYQGAGSPDRADALVWAGTELMLGKGGAVRLTTV